MEQNHIQLWEKCLEIFRDNLPAEQFDAWFKPVTSLSYTNNNLNVLVPSPFFVEQLDERYIKLITRTLHKVYGPDVKLFYHFNQVVNEPSTGVTMQSANPSPAVAPRPGASSNPFAERRQPAEIDAQLNPRYTFENYCRGNSNHVARSIGDEDFQSAFYLRVAGCGQNPPHSGHRYPHQGAEPDEQGALCHRPIV